ncbi:hypothetical protein JOM56_001729 [Amanita muscaria]
MLASTKAQYTPAPTILLLLLLLDHFLLAASSNDLSNRIKSIVPQFHIRNGALGLVELDIAHRGVWEENLHSASLRSRKNVAAARCSDRPWWYKVLAVFVLCVEAWHSLTMRRANVRSRSR